MNNEIIKLTKISKKFSGSHRDIVVLRNVNLKINKGELVSLTGPSGSGKTTLLNCLSALDSPTEGSYSFEGKPVPTLPNLPPKTRITRPDGFFLSLLADITNLAIKIGLWIPEYFSHSRPTALSNEKMTTFRRNNVGYVFQFFNLLQDLTVMENIMLIQEISGGRDTNRAEEILRLVGLEEEMHRFPSEISGGQQQRVAIARSIAKKPRLLLGDELTGNLDSETSTKVMDVLIQACKSEGITTVMVTHDESLAKYATRIIRLDSGKVKSDEQVKSK